LDAQNKVEGARSVRLSSESEQAPHVYCGLRQQLSPLLPGLAYRVTFKAKGAGVGSCWFGGGPGWKLRRGFPKGSFDWRPFSFEFTCPANQEHYEFRVNVDSVTEALWIDDVQLTALVPEQQPVVTALAADDSSIVALMPGPAVSVDGDLSEWGENDRFLKSTDGRIEAGFQIACSAKGLFIAARTRDDSVRRAGAEAEMWQYDSVQVSVDPLNEKSVSGYGPHDFELGFGDMADGPAVYAWQRPEGVKQEALEDIEAAIAHADGTTCYEIGIPWDLLREARPEPGAAFGLNIVVNDRDLHTDRATVEWTPGTVFSKQPRHYKTLVLTDGPWVHLEAAPRLVMAGHPMRFLATVYSPEAVDGTARLGDLFDGPVSLGAGLTQCLYHVPETGAFAEGENKVDFALDAGGARHHAATTVTVSTAERDALDLIAAQEARLPGVEAKLEAAKAGGLPGHYPQADFLIAKRFCTYCRDDVAHARYERALEVALEVKELLDRAEAEMRDGVVVPVLDPDTAIEIRNGSFWAECTVGNATEFRPVFLTGYGHFSPVVADLPLLGDIGVNVIQIEMGPKSIVFEDGVRTDQIEAYVIAALDRARDNGVRVCLLISPHYFPGWAFEKWPELAIEKAGFIRNTVDAPQVRDVYEEQLRTLIPLIQDHPALHSICLSNEPVSMGSWNDPFRLPLWRAYIERKHETIEHLNAAWGADYASFDDVPHPVLAFDEDPRAVYDGVRFNQEAFAEWHAWMVGVIHSMAPDLPCHAKVMCLPSSSGTVFWGTDPWDFANLSQINGNDCYFMQHKPGGEWASGWHSQNMYYDLQRSMKRVPVFNTENHIIRDREMGYIAASHIYTAIWQGAVHGQGGSTTWAWQRTFDEKSDFEGLILHRAACTAAMSRCALDLMRLSEQVAALQNAVPQVALLYSHAATLWDREYIKVRSKVYEALNFCGVPIAFITDEQIAAGRLEPYRCLIIPGAQHASRDAIEGIREFKAGFGHVIAYGPDNLTADEYDRPVSPPKFNRTIRNKEGEGLRDVLSKGLAKAGIHPATALTTPDGQTPYGVEWRGVPHEGRPLVNIVNLSPGPIAVNLPAGAWTDLITQTPLANPITLEPNVPVLAASK